MKGFGEITYRVNGAYDGKYTHKKERDAAFSHALKNME
jgi:hypothetical protein